MHWQNFLEKINHEKLLQQVLLCMLPKDFKIVRRSHRRCSVKRGVVKNLANFTGKHLRWSAKTWRSRKTLQHRCFPVKFAKYLRTPMLKNICEFTLKTTIAFSIFVIIVNTNTLAFEIQQFKVACFFLNATFSGYSQPGWVKSKPALKKQLPRPNLHRINCFNCAMRVISKSKNSLIRSAIAWEK